MKSFAMGLLKAAALWLVLMIGQIAGGMLFFHAAPAAPVRASDGPLDAGQALLVVSAIEAVVLALLASYMRLRGWRLGLTLAAAFFGIETFQPQIETVIFNAAVHMPVTLLYGIVAMGLIHAALVGAAAAVLWRGPGEAPLQLPGLVWKAPLIAVFYIACYLTAGAQIAMRFAAARAYYHYTHFGQGIGYLLGLQFCRGLIWCGLVWLMARSLTRPAWRAALLAGLALAGLMDPMLLYPNPLMPWPVRVAHLWEIAVSNTVFGVVAALILLAGAREAAASASGAPSPQLAGA
jgi:hypothetical protein